MTTFVAHLRGYVGLSRVLAKLYYGVWRKYSADFTSVAPAAEWRNNHRQNGGIQEHRIRTGN